MKIKNTGRKEIDIKKDEVIRKAKNVISQFKCGNTVGIRKEAEDAKKAIRSFRVSLGMNKGTEFLEGDFGWTPIFENLNKELEFIIESSQNKNHLQ